MLGLSRERRLQSIHISPLTGIRPKFFQGKFLRTPVSKPVEKRDEHHCRLESARSNAIFLSIDRFAFSRKSPVTLESYILEKLSSSEFQNPSRHLLFDKIILLLLRRRQFKSAFHVYNGMIDEGILASATVQHRMLAFTEAYCCKDSDQVRSSLETVFSVKEYGEHCLHELLDFLVQLDRDPRLIDSVFRLYVESREEGYIPSGKLTSHVVDILARGGLMSSVRRILKMRADALSGPDILDDDEVSDAAYPYVAMLAARSDKRAINAILARMERDNIIPAVSTFNSLIGMHARRREYSVTLAWYRTFMYRLRAPTTSGFGMVHLRPDAYTFRSLFDALRMVRGRRSRNSRRSAYNTWSRKVYHDLVSCHLVETRGRPAKPSSIVNHSILNIALRTFMVAGDYPGAFVVVRSFRIFKVKPTLYTYQVVLRSLMASVRLEKKNQKKYITPTGMLRLLNVGPEEESSGIYEKMLRLCRGSGRISQGESGRRTKANTSRRSYRLPSPAMLKDHEPVSPLPIYDSIPLERILRRVIFAVVEGTGVSSNPVEDNSSVAADGNPSPTKRVWELLVRAKQTMIPEMPRTMQKYRPDQRRHGSSKYR